MADDDDLIKNMENQFIGFRLITTKKENRVFPFFVISMKLPTGSFFIFCNNRSVQYALNFP
jgi:hypothetical protein